MTGSESSTIEVKVVVELPVAVWASHIASKRWSDAGRIALNRKRQSPMSSDSSHTNSSPSVTGGCAGVLEPIRGCHKPDVQITALTPIHPHT